MRYLILGVIFFANIAYALPVAKLDTGGIGTTTVPTNYVLLGLNSNRVTAVATSSLGIVATGDGTFATTSADYWITASTTIPKTTLANIWSLLQTLTLGFISNASSTITSGLFSMNGGASTTALTISGASWLGTPSVLVGTNITGTASGLTAGLATALAANGANCLAGNYPLGVNASGAVEDCTAAGAGTVTSVTATAPLFSSGGTTPNITWAGLATTSQLSSSNLLVSNGGAGVYGVATGTVSASGGVTVTAGRSAVGGALAITCTASDTNNTGCLSDTDWDTFNLKESALTFNYPLTRSVNAISTAATSTAYGSGTAGNVLMWDGTKLVIAATSTGGTGTVTSIATTYPILGGTITTTGTLSFPATSTLFAGSAGQVLAFADGIIKGVATTTFSSGLTYSNGNVTNSGVTSIVAGTNISIDQSVGAVTISASGSGTAGGSDTQVQFNDGGTTLGGAVGFVWNKVRGMLGVGTTTPQWLVQLASSTAPQLTLSDNNGNHTVFRNMADYFFIGTSSPATFATTTTPLLNLATNYAGTTTISGLVESLGFTVDGGSSVITTGVKGYIEVPYDADIVGWTALSTDTSTTVGTTTIDVWKDTYANYPPTVADTIFTSTKVGIYQATKSQSTSTPATFHITAGDILGFNVDSVSALKRVTVIIKVKRR